MTKPDDWPWTGALQCGFCKTPFTVPNPEGESPSFCPFCASPDVQPYTAQPGEEQ